MDLSIIIVNWNTRDILRNCLRSIYGLNAGQVDFETIVIDNASTDGSVEMLKSKFPQVRVIQNTRNHGFAAANNQGIKAANSKYVLLLNSDTLVLDNAIGKIVEFADNHPKAAVVGCRVLNPDGTLQPACFMFPSILNIALSITYVYKLFSRSRFFGRERMTWWHRNEVREVDIVTGCFMLVRQEAIKQVGMMDEQFFMYFEETDWCCRFKQAGWKVMFTPDAEIIHLGGASTNQAKPKMVMQWRKSMLLFFKKHRSPIAYGLAWILIDLFYLTRAPYWLGRQCLRRSRIGETREESTALELH